MGRWGGAGGGARGVVQREESLRPCQPRPVASGGSCPLWDAWLRLETFGCHQMSV